MPSGDSCSLSGKAKRSPDRRVVEISAVSQGDERALARTEAADRLENGVITDGRVHFR